MIVYLNGDWIDDAQACVSIHDAGLVAGDGVFETALLRNGRYLRLDAHLARFAESAATLALDPPPATALRDIAAGLVARNALAEGSLRVTLTRGRAGRPTVLATLQPIDPAWRTRAAAGWSLITARTRRPSTAAVPPQLKALGRTYALLARGEARAAGADDALLLTDDGLVCEGPTWNIFWRRGETLFTPRLELGVLAGITRALLLETAPHEGLDIREVSAPRADLDEAEEIFATMTSVGPVSIRALDGRPLPAAAPAADRLRAAYWALVDAETGRE